MEGIDITDLDYRYPGADERILSRVDMRVEAGETRLLLGPSGSGKSTLARCIAGLVPQSTGGTVNGRVRVCGHDALAATPGTLSTDVGLVFQNPETQFVTSTVATEVAFGLENLRVPPAEIEARITESLATVGLSGFEDRRIDALSGGEKQRLAIACQLAMEPELLVLDEPTANLDPQGTSEMFEFLRERARDPSATTVVIEHRCDPLMDVFDSVFALNQAGETLLSGPTREVFDRHAETLRHSGLWTPDVTRLGRRLRSDGSWPDSTPLPVTVAQCLDAVGGVPTPVESTTARKRHDSPAPAIDIRALESSYEDGESTEPVLKEISLAVPTGSFFAVVGPNGAGKSTLAKHCVDVLTPPAGTVYVGGRDVTALGADDLRQRVGYVFQNPECQFLTDCVRNELAYGLEQLDLDADEIQHRVDRTLGRFGLRSKSERNPFALSHGEKRRLSVATMLVVEQETIIVDEPTYGQDRRNEKALMETLSELHDAGRTIVMLTHDMRLVAEYADRVAVLTGGEIQFQGAPSALFGDRETLEAARLARPPLAPLAAQSGADSTVATVEECHQLYRARNETSSAQGTIDTGEGG